MSAGEGQFRGEAIGWAARMSSRAGRSEGKTPSHCSARQGFGTVFEDVVTMALQVLGGCHSSFTSIQ